MQHTRPRTPSQSLLSPMWWTISYSESANPFDENFRPSRFFIWAPMIMSDVADVKAFVTGTDIKSTIKPIENKTIV